MIFPDYVSTFACILILAPGHTNSLPSFMPWYTSSRLSVNSSRLALCRNGIDKARFLITETPSTEDCGACVVADEDSCQISNEAPKDFEVCDPYMWKSLCRSIGWKGRGWQYEGEMREAWSQWPEPLKRISAARRREGYGCICAKVLFTFEDDSLANSCM